MKYMEEKLPADEFIPYTVLLLSAWTASAPSGAVLIEQKDVPIGDAYRERVKGYVSRLAVL